MTGGERKHTFDDSTHARDKKVGKQQQQQQQQHYNEQKIDNKNGTRHVNDCVLKNKSKPKKSQ